MSASSLQLPAFSLRDLRAGSWELEAGSFFYQLLFVTPAISPCSASLRKQRRQSANLRRYARGRPQRWQRFRRRTLYFGDFCSFAIFAVVAMLISVPAF